MKKDIEAVHTVNDTKSIVHNILGYKYRISASENGFELSQNKTKGQFREPKSIYPFMMSIWPTLFQSTFKNLLSKAFPQFSGNDNGSIVHTGALRRDNIFYNKIDKLSSLDQLPDILITTDLNSLYHQGFTHDFLNNNNFEALGFPMHPMFSDTSFSDPKNLFTMLGSDTLVMVVDKLKYLSIPMPREWYELLNPQLSKSIVMCGDRDYFCNTLLCHYVKNFGYEAVRQIAKNTLSYIHPEEMLESIHSKEVKAASIYIMPYSYAKTIKNKVDYQIIWPEDGAILIPIQMLVKKGYYEKHIDIINFLTGEILGADLEKNGFVSTNPKTNKSYPDTTLNWIGWDYIAETDIHKMKMKIRAILSDKELEYR